MIIDKRTWTWTYGTWPWNEWPGEKAKDFKGTMKTLMSYLGKYTYAIIVVFIFAIGSVAFSVIGPKILGKATTEIFNGLVRKVSGRWRWNRF